MTLAARRYVPLSYQSCLFASQKIVEHVDQKQLLALIAASDVLDLQSLMELSILKVHTLFSISLRAAVVAGRMCRLAVSLAKATSRQEWSGSALLSDVTIRLDPSQGTPQRPSLPRHQGLLLLAK
jgi:hypothetical protein